MTFCIEFIAEHAHQAHIYLFFLIMLAGLNVPLSEDVLLLIGGAFAGFGEVGVHIMLLWLYAACILSAWEAYALGRILGPRLLTIPLFAKILPQRRQDKLKNAIAMYDPLPFFIIRFIPGGMRNAFFMTAGLTKMPFHLFAFKDAVACLLPLALLFSLGFFFGTHFEVLVHILRRCQLGILLFAAMIFFVWFIYTKRKKSKLIRD